MCTALTTTGSVVDVEAWGAAYSMQFVNKMTFIPRVMIGFPSKWASWPDKKEDPVRLVQTSNKKK